MKKRIAALLLAMLLVFSLTGCQVVENMRLKRLLKNDFYEYINEELLAQINLGPTDAHWDWLDRKSVV